LRFALCGEEVRIGSRQAERAAAAAEQARAQLAAVGCRTALSGHENAAATEGADIVVLALPYASVAETIPALASRLAGKVVLDVVNPLVRKNGVFRSEHVAAGSAAEEIQRLLPNVPVVSAFKTLSAQELVRIPESLHGDVLVCSDHDGPRARVLDLVRCLPMLRPIDSGALVNSRALESITALLLNLNRRHRAITSIQILGLDSGAW
jgi:NADPH-dependent F420 reductase